MSRYQDSGSQLTPGTRGPRLPPGGLTGLERGLDGGREELRSLRIDDDVPAQRHTADDLPCVRERAGRASGGGGGTGGIGLGHIRDCRRNQRPLDC